MKHVLIYPCPLLTATEALLSIGYDPLTNDAVLTLCDPKGKPIESRLYPLTMPEAVTGLCFLADPAECYRQNFGRHYRMLPKCVVPVEYADHVYDFTDAELAEIELA